MYKRNFLAELGVTRGEFLTTLLVVVNAFTWYLVAFQVLVHTLDTIGLTPYEITVIWTVHFSAIACAALVGATLPNKLISRDKFLSLWMFLGVVSSLVPMIIGACFTCWAVISFLWAVAFGLGMPSCMGYYADFTVIENRGRLGALIFFAINIGLFLLGTILMPLASLAEQLIVLTIWRGLGLASFLVLKPTKGHAKVRKKPSYMSILRRKPLLLYLIPWIMFSLVNSMTRPLFPANIVEMASLITFIIAALFTLVGGLLSDLIGRKPMVIFGFLILGVGYAVLGMFPGGIAYYVYAVVDGVAWGMLGVIFLMVVWGDFSENMPSEKYYAIGGLPYLLSIFLEILIAPYIKELIPPSATFSFASLFLFLAIMPLLYAPETLPEKKIREREFKKYIEKAKKIKEKYD